MMDAWMMLCSELRSSRFALAAWKKVSPRVFDEGDGIVHALATARRKDFPALHCYSEEVTSPINRNDDES